MAERSHFWTTGTTGDGATTYTEAQLGEWLRDLFTPNSTISTPHASEGVLRGAGGELAVTGTASPVSVASGAAVTEGFFYRNDAAVNVAIPTPASNTRIDRIVLRASHGTTRTVRITRIAGTEGAGAPSLTQTAGTTWDIPLAQVSITTGGVITVTDQRSFCHFGTKVSTGMLDDAAVTAPKFGSGAVVTHLGYTPWHAGNDGDGSGLDADKVAGVAIAPAQRQGGSASVWGGNNPGTTNRGAPADMRFQFGCATLAASGYTTITFPVAFSAIPLVFFQPEAGARVVESNGSPTASDISVRLITVSSSPTQTGGVIWWLAIGPT